MYLIKYVGCRIKTSLVGLVGMRVRRGLCSGKVGGRPWRGAEGVVGLHLLLVQISGFEGTVL